MPTTTPRSPTPTIPDVWAILPGARCAWRTSRRRSGSQFNLAGTRQPHHVHPNRVRPTCDGARFRPISVAALPRHRAGIMMQPRVLGNDHPRRFGARLRKRRFRMVRGPIQRRPRECCCVRWQYTAWHRSGRHSKKGHPTVPRARLRRVHVPLLPSAVPTPSRRGHRFRAVEWEAATSIEGHYANNTQRHSTRRFAAPRKAP